MKNNFKNNFIKELGSGIVLLVLLLLILNPFHMWMPSMMVDVVLVLLLAVFGIFAVYLFQENVADEREDNHRMLSGRFAFLSGSAVLIIGIVIEGFMGKTDPWLFLALVVMIFVKIATRVYTDRSY